MHGRVPWGQVLKKLSTSNDVGSDFIELEDATFNGATESEKRGLLAATDCLANC